MSSPQSMNQDMLNSRTVDRAESHIKTGEIERTSIKLHDSWLLSDSAVLLARYSFPGQREFLSEVVKETKGILGGNWTVLCPDCNGGYNS